MPKVKIEKPVTKRAPWNVVAPDGFRFVDGPHVLTDCWTRQEAERLAENSPIEPCPADCDCGEGS